MREQITAAICAAIHSSHQPETFAHVLTREKCVPSHSASDAVLVVFAAEFQPDGVPPGDAIPVGDHPESVAWLQGWDQCRSAVLACLGVDDQAVQR